MFQKCVMFVASCFLLFAAGCAANHFWYEPVEPMKTLDVSFVDAKWDGKVVPAGEQCNMCQGENAMSPALKVSDIPSGADKIIVEFNDRDYKPLSSKGGHGAIAVAVPAGKDSVVVPSVPNESMKLPEGVESVKRHKATARGVSKGAYLAPCSCGHGHEYFAVVHAVNTSSGKVLAQKTIELGTF